MRSRRLDQSLAVAQIRPEGDDAIRRAETPAQEADNMQVAEPFAIRHITLPPWHVLDVAGVHQEDREPASLQDLIERNPVDARGFHRDARHAAGREPVGQTMEIAGKRGKRSDRRRVTIRWHGDEVLGRPTIDASGVRVDAFEH